MIVDHLLQSHESRREGFHGKYSCAGSLARRVDREQADVRADIQYDAIRTVYRIHAPGKNLPEGSQVRVRLDRDRPATSQGQHIGIGWVGESDDGAGYAWPARGLGSTPENFRGTPGLPEETQRTGDDHSRGPAIGTIVRTGPTSSSGTTRGLAPHWWFLGPGHPTD